MKIVFINIFVNILHIIWILNISFCIIKIIFAYFFTYVNQTLILCFIRIFAYKYILSISRLFSTKFNNRFFPRCWAAYYDYSAWMISIMLSFILIRAIIKIYHLYFHLSNHFLYLWLLYRHFICSLWICCNPIKCV